MKKVSFISCTGALFGFLSPLSFLTEANLKKGIGMMESGVSNFFYISVEDYNQRRRELRAEYITENVIKNLDHRTAGRITIASSAYNFEILFAEYISCFKEEVVIDVLGGISERVCLNARIDEFLSEYARQLEIEHSLNKMPAYFMT